MAQRTDLHTILISYANKNNSPYIDITTFLEFLQKYARRHSEEQPEWLKWAHDTSTKFWAEIAVLVEDDKCELLTDTEQGRVYMPHYYMELLKKSYQNADEDADLPFPSEESLRITLPEGQIWFLNSENDIMTYLEGHQDSDIPIIKINFPDEAGSALVLPEMIPRQLTEMAILKIRNYLRKGGNKEYSLRKLTPQLQGKEAYLRDQLNQILTRPLDCYNGIKDGGELSFLFWAHFCILIKNDIKKIKERLPEDNAVSQSGFIISSVGTYFKNQAVKKREADLAFNSLENHLGKPPYLYTLEQILKFTNAKGVLLLGQYNDDELQAWLRKKTTESENEELPVLLIFEGLKGERYFIHKSKMLSLATRLLAEARGKIKDELNKHWRRLLMDFQQEPAMENDREFEKSLKNLAGRLCPMLTSLLEDPKLLLSYDEMEKSQNGIPLAAKIFEKGKLLSYSDLLLLRRKEILTDAKLILPIWYSIPVISAIIAFFYKLSKRKKAFRIADAGEEEEQNAQEDKGRSREIRNAAGELELTLVPSGYTLDSYLEELETRWSRLIDKKARENLIEDVKSLIKDNLRQNLKLSKHFGLTQENISQMASNIVTRTPTLASLSGRDSLILYSELYLIKLLQSVR